MTEKEIQIELGMKNEELHRAQERLEASGESFPGFYDLAPLGYCTLSEKGFILEANLTTATLLGLPRSELIGKPISLFILKADEGIHYRQRKHIFESHEPQACELRMIKKDGTVFWARLEATTATGAHIDPTCRIVMSNITESKRAEEDLVRSEEIFRLITENMMDCVALVDKHGIYKYVSPSYKSTLGYEPEEMIGMSGFGLTHPDDVEKIALFYLEAIEAGWRENIYETRLRHKAGHYVPMEIRARALTDSEGEIIGGVVAGRDIASRKQAEEELARHKNNLEDIVKERTEELEIKNIALQELNTTLKVILKQREDDKKDTEEKFVMNVRNLVLPFVVQMKKGYLDAGQRLYLDIIEKYLHDIATPLLKNIRQFNLTPMEIKVAALVKQGKSTKEVAEILGLAGSSIDVHRKNVRKKLGLGNKKVNLQSYLDTLE